MTWKDKAKGGGAGKSPDPRFGTAGQGEGKSATAARGNHPEGGAHGQPLGKTYRKPQHGTAGQPKSGD
jgi:hypothetical protein